MCHPLLAVLFRRCPSDIPLCIVSNSGAIWKGVCLHCCCRSLFDVPIAGTIVSFFVSRPLQSYWLPSVSEATARSTGSFKFLRHMFRVASPITLAFCSRFILASIWILVLVGFGFFGSFSSSFVSASIRPFLNFFFIGFCSVSVLIWFF
jgi:hypothetical protein